MKTIRFLFISLFSLSFISQELLAIDLTKYGNSIVKVYAYQQSYNYAFPWQAPSQVEGYGSGFILPNKRIMTNAHVVTNPAFIQVRLANSDIKFPAEVEFVSHEADLAILKVKDDEFFKTSAPLEFAKDFAGLNETVHVLGFPAGGDELAITKGIISRIEMSVYAHSGTSLLTAQIDAAVNPGNSGGPVIKEVANGGHQIVGVAFQGASSLQNTSYMIPIPVIDHFLKDIAKGSYSGFPQVGVHFQLVENPNFKFKHGLKKNEGGAYITKINPLSNAASYLKVGDIVTAVDGIKVGNDGKIEIRTGIRVLASYLFSTKQIGDELQLTVLRDGEKKDIKFAVTNRSRSFDLVTNKIYDTPPTYFIFGGLVFQPLSRNYLENWGKDWYHTAPKDLLYMFFFLEKSKISETRIVLNYILPDKTNVGYENQRDQLVSLVNGHKIETMQDLISAFENHKDDFHEIVVSENNRIILKSDEVKASTPSLLERFNISSERSADLK